VTTAHPSSSDVQQETEEIIRGILASTNPGVSFASERIACGKEWVSIDAVGRDKNGEIVQLVDIYARQGKLKGGQLKKPTDDAARLMLAAQHSDGTPCLRLVWCCQQAVGQVRRGWRGLALEAMGVEIEAVGLPASQVERILQAQKRQYR